MAVLQGMVSGALGAVLAQGAMAAPPPGAGGAIQQIPRVPQRPRPGIELRIERAHGAPLARRGGRRIEVDHLRLEGARAIAPAVLRAAIGFKPGAQFSLGDLDALAAKITDYYREHGYFVARAYLPPQRVEDGTVTVRILEGVYGKVELHNRGAVSEALARRLLGSVAVGRTVAAQPLERGLLLLSDLPGVDVKSTLVPGAAVGSSNLIVALAPGRRVSGSIDADNAGSRYTGANRLGLTLHVNHPAGRGDVFTARVFTSSNSGLNYGRFAYQMPFGATQAGFAYTAFDYKLGDAFSSLGAHGTAGIASVYARYAVLRSRARNVYLQADFDDKAFDDRLDLTGSDKPKRVRVLVLSMSGDRRSAHDQAQFTLTTSVGHVELDSPVGLAVDAGAAQVNGAYGKLAGQGSWLHALGGHAAAFAQISAQLASHNLDMSEQMELGGDNAVRAYPEGEAYADEGYVLSVELRRDLPLRALPGALQGVLFCDNGSVRLHKDAFSSQANTRTLSGAGLGVNWVDDARFLLKAYWAHRLGSAPATSAPDASSRFWIQAVRYF